MNPASPKVQYNFFLILLIATGIIIFFIFRPFLSPVVIGGSLAIVFYPLYEWLTAKLNNRKNLAAFITVLLILVLILGPVLLIGNLLFGEARDLYTSIDAHNGENTFIQGLTHSIESKLQHIAPDINLNVEQYTQNGLEWILTHLDSFFSSFLEILVGTFMMVFAVFFLLRDGRAFKDKLFTLSPLKQEFDQGIFVKLVGAVNSVVKGSLLISITQGLFVGIGLMLAGVPNPVLWGVVAIFASLLPGIGTTLITVPWIIYLLLTAPLVYGLGLAVWAGLGIGLIDNVLSPYVINQGIKIHPFLIFISVIGGVAYFGPIGFILGPVIFAFFFALLDIYPLIFHSE
jgi:predicted PurR-regulated permease PerM